MFTFLSEFILFPRAYFSADSINGRCTLHLSLFYLNPIIYQSSFFILSFFALL